MAGGKHSSRGDALGVAPPPPHGAVAAPAAVAAERVHIDDAEQPLGESLAARTAHVTAATTRALRNPGHASRLRRKAPLTQWTKRPIVPRGPQNRASRCRFREYDTRDRPRPLRPDHPRDIDRAAECRWPKSSLSGLRKRAGPPRAVGWTRGALGASAARTPPVSMSGLRQALLGPPTDRARPRGHQKGCRASPASRLARLGQLLASDQAKRERREAGPLHHA